MSQHITDLLDARLPMRFYDPELWDFMIRQMGRNLECLSTDALIARLHAIEKNIQYLHDSAIIRHHVREDRGWTSFVWWLRARHWTLAELKQRSISPDPSPMIVKKRPLNQRLIDITVSNLGILARAGKARFLSKFLHGELRFTPATTYDDKSLGAARADDEMVKSLIRPAKALTIKTPGGHKIEAIGGVRFSSSRKVEVGGSLVDRPYLFCSFSNEIDPRLIDEFPGSDAILVILNVDEFMARSISHLDAVMPGPKKGLVPNEYYDPYYIFRHGLSAIRSKELDYAYQREVRFVIDPGHDVFRATDIVTTNATSFVDIAALYDRSGTLIDGAGPKQLFDI